MGGIRRGTSGIHVYRYFGKRKFFSHGTYTSRGDARYAASLPPVKGHPYRIRKLKGSKTNSYGERVTYWELYVKWKGM